MSYAEAQRNPTKHSVGIAIVLLMHVLLVWALFSGLARKVVEVVKAPIETKIIEEVKPPPPPPPENLPPPPKNLPPPPAFVPPPEVQVTPPPMPAPAITTTNVQPPPTPVVISAAPPAPGPAASGPVVVPPKGDFNSSCDKAEIPRAAQLEDNFRGELSLRVSFGTDGRVTNVQVLKASGSSPGHRAMQRVILSTVKDTCKFTPGTVDGVVQPLSRDLVYAFKLVD